MEPIEQSHLHLRYALQKETESHLRFVDDVPKGLKCNCVCPYCKVDLMARQGQKREHYFAHKNNNYCTGGRMTALHILAQNVLTETKQVMLPEYKSWYNPHPAKLTTFDRVEKEEVCRNENSMRRPDCIGYNDSKGSNIWIEIYCRHKIDEAKKAEIRKHQLYCIEIDFSDLLKTNYSEEDVRNRLLDSSHSEWICCPVWDAEEERLRIDAEARWQAEEEERKKSEEEYRKMVAEVARERIEEGKRREEYRLRQQAKTHNLQNNFASSPKYRDEQGAEFRTPWIPFEKKDRIIQAVHGASIDPKNENYSEELAKKFNNQYQ